MRFAALRICTLTTDQRPSRTRGALLDSLLHWGLQPFARKVTGELAAARLLALDRKLGAMALQHVLDDRQTQAGTAGTAAAAGIDAVEPLGQPGNVFRGDADTGVGD